MARHTPTVRLHLVRHGRATAGWTEDLDPDLDEVGRSQAEAMAGELAKHGPMPVVSSPLRRARSTAAALERIWGVRATVEPRVGELPSPVGPDGDLAARGPWLRRVLLSRWDDPELDPRIQQWRRELVEALTGLERETVVTTHFVAINAVVGVATGDQRVTCFRPDYCSRTVVDVVDGTVRLVALGREAPTDVR